MTYIVAVFKGESRRSIAVVDEFKRSSREDADQLCAELKAQGLHVGIFTSK